MEKLNSQWINAGEKLISLSETTGAIKYGKFKLSSGKSSGYYFDGRLLTLHPQGLQVVSSVFLPALRALQADCVAGPTIGAAPIIAGLVLTSGYSGDGINGLIVRKEVKNHGMSKMIEGELNRGSRVVIVDDTCSTGGSLIKAIEVIEDQGCIVAGVLTILDRNMGGREKITKRGYKFASILKVDSSEKIFAGDLKSQLFI